MTQKNLVSKRFGHRPDIRSSASDDQVVGTSLVGIEVELEGVHHPNRVAKFLERWQATRDGSLKNNGVEFIFAQPLGGVDIVHALNELENAINKIGEDPVLSERTSVHVHVDIRDLTDEEYINLLILYMIFERSLFRVCGPDRADNTFCRAVCETYGLVMQIANMNMDHEYIPMEIDRVHRRKYMALNIGSTQTFGSVEFRGHRGEWRAEPLLKWVNLLLSLKEFSRQEIVWEQMLVNISSEGYEGFARRVFGEHTRTIQHPNLTYEIVEGVRDAQDIIFAKEMRGTTNDFRPQNDDDGDILIPYNFRQYLEKLNSKSTKPKRRKE